jgi:hypothetical protein
LLFHLQDKYPETKDRTPSPKIYMARTSTT